MNETPQSYSLKRYFFPLTTLKAFHIIALLGLFVFFNILYNNFVWDDLSYLVNNPQIQTLNWGRIFGPSLFNGTDIGYYRPVTALYFTITYFLFQNNPLPYHISQLVLHIVCTCFVYMLLARFMNRRFSLLLSLIFLVHPFQVESVALITSTDSELFFLFGIIAFFLSIKKEIDFKRSLSIFTLLLCSCLTKETGVLFIVMIIIYRLFFVGTHIKSMIICGASTLVMYFIIRFGIGHVYFAQGSPKVIMVHTPLLIRLVNIPAIMFFYLRTFVFPTQMVIDQQWVITHISLYSFYIPLFICIGFIVLVIYVSYLLYAYKRKSFLPFVFFFLWFMGGIGMVLQILPLDMTVGDRWFYFPIVGILGMIGVLLQSIRFSRNSYSIVTTCFIIVIIALSILTFLRNEVWHDEITLFEHDIPILKTRDSTLSVGQLENDLSAYLLQENQVNKAEYYALDSLHYDPIPNRYNTVGLMYQVKGDGAKAAYWYQKAIQTDNLEKAYDNYAVLLLMQKRNTNAVTLIKKGLLHYPKDSELWECLAYAQFFLNDRVDALDSARMAYDLNQNQNTLIVFRRLLNNETISL